MQRLLFAAACLTLAASQATTTIAPSSSPPSTSAKTTTAGPKFLDFLNADPVVEQKTTTSKPKSDEELKNALTREDELKKELVTLRNALADRATAAAPSAAAVVPNKPGNDDLQARLFFGAAPGSTQDHSNQFTAKLLGGSNGLMGLLNPKIMDQQDAASKLIPSLDNNPSVAKFRQMTQSANQQPMPRQMPLGNNPTSFGQPNVFPYQPQVPLQGAQGFPGSFQQPGYGSQLGGSPMGMGGQMSPLLGNGGLAGAGLGGMGQVNPLGGATNFQNPSMMGGMGGLGGGMGGIGGGMGGLGGGLGGGFMG